ncbi:RING/FYVE/PHD zinc finger superfamily protein [Rhynchospora pubera]|uniref:RING-CH-type domain-containing protein n=3 Tax=Rhynchospora TaxID=46332 RepID=A0A9Q0CMJ6_9POAL|nr:hypothetical protein LUZ63_005197 [Rhynchospora breviuscula]KAJ3697020.1 hypothetical protein LUZ61_000725 [Rhynchospora tenuis]KAJ4756326.1 RING/FYVE/PHD zinc finger superfamily protein [Rhynchospora pubera]KAJ4761988.1 RING/FYVE/PHD zinc finger superfamily protein [Rhynchospora pubera]KAJ4790646.1 RING/FYVE/PHD zinc finger superfamily protein [Rhynchospora pubera]
MGDHVVLDVDELVKPKSDEGTCASVAVNVVSEGMEPGRNSDVGQEAMPLLQMAECRICQEEDSVSNLEMPCACSGSLKYAHRACVQRWCNEKGDVTCEICHEIYKPGYVAPPPRPSPDETTIDLSGGWTITGTPLDLHDPRILAVAAAQRRLLEAEYDEYAATNASGAAFCRSAALILMALLLLRHAMTITNDDGDDDASTIFSLFLLRAAGFLLPCYIMAWAISVLQRRRQRQEAAAMAAAEVAFILQTSRGRALQFAIAPESPATPQHEPH